MDIFISHKTEDKSEALHAKNFLEERGFTTYLAVLDDVISIEKDVSAYLRTKIENHTNLLVIMTENTKESWWVPFEVGVATECDKKIATAYYFNADKTKLASFLRKWPVIDAEAKFQQYAEYVKKDRKVVLNEAQSLMKSASVTASAKDKLQKSQRTSDIFHEVLKINFGQ